MAYYLFTDAILKGLHIKVFNSGLLQRDFTYIDDIVDGTIEIILKPSKHNNGLYRIYNMGNNNPMSLMDFVKAIEKSLGKKAKKIMMPMQLVDVPKTWADIEDLKRNYKFHPKTQFIDGIGCFIDWYINYFDKKID